MQLLHVPDDYLLKTIEQVISVENTNITLLGLVEHRWLSPSPNSTKPLVSKQWLAPRMLGFTDQNYVCGRRNQSWPLPLEGGFTRWMCPWQQWLRASRNRKGAHVLWNQRCHCFYESCRQCHQGPTEAWRLVIAGWGFWFPGPCHGALGESESEECPGAGLRSKSSGAGFSASLGKYHRFV